MKFSALAMSCVVLFALVGYAHAGDWTEFKSEAGGFSILLPGTPKDQVTKVPSAGGDLEAHMLLVNQDNDAYLVAYGDFPAGTVAASNADMLLSNARDGQASNTLGKVRSDKKITVNDNPGRDVVIDGPNDVVIRSRIVLVKNRLYQAMVVGKKGIESSDEVNKMMDSFKFVTK